MRIVRPVSRSYKDSCDECEIDSFDPSTRAQRGAPASAGGGGAEHEQGRRREARGQRPRRTGKRARARTKLRELETGAPALEARAHADHERRERGAQESLAERVEPQRVEGVAAIAWVSTRGARRVLPPRVEHARHLAEASATREQSQPE